VKRGTAFIATSLSQKENGLSAVFPTSKLHRKTKHGAWCVYTIPMNNPCQFYYVE